MRRIHIHSQRIHIGIDNGVTGSVGVIVVSRIEKATVFKLMPTFSEQNYTKKRGNITRIDVLAFKKFLEQFYGSGAEVRIERPMVNPGRFKATISAIRTLESTLCVLESLEMVYSYIDSKEWQKVLLPKGTKGPAELKRMSMQIGCRLFPEHKEAIQKHGDADGLLIAEFCRRTG